MNVPPQYEVPEDDAPLLCDVCGADLAADIMNGWVAWYEDRNYTQVSEFFVTCHFVRIDGQAMDVFEYPSCMLKVQEDLEARGFFTRDMHLSAFVGSNAIEQLSRLIWSYEWSRPALARCLAFFVKASRLHAPPQEGDGV
jgi:hypothetical protein